MYAPILTYDLRHALAQLTIESYLKYWPNNELIFRVPYNDIKPNWDYKNVEYIQCDKHVKPTMRALLEGISDNAFVYWAFDDIYLCFTENNALQKVYNYLINEKNPNFDAIKFLKFHDEKLDKKNKIQLSGKFILYKRHHFKYRFWYHMFCKSKLLKEVFLNNDVEENMTIAKIERIRCRHDKKYIIYSPEKDMQIQGETTRGNIMTSNCVKALKQYNIAMPDLKGITPAIILNGANINGKDNQGFPSTVKGKDYLKKYL